MDLLSSEDRGSGGVEDEVVSCRVLCWSWSIVMAIVVESREVEWNELVEDQWYY